MKLLQDIPIAHSESSRSGMHSYKNRHIALCTAYSKFPMHFPFYHILSLDESFRQIKRQREVENRSKERMRDRESEKLRIQRRKLEQFHFRSWLMRLFALSLSLLHPRRTLHICSFPSFSQTFPSVLAIRRFILSVPLGAFAIKSNHFNCKQNKYVDKIGCIATASDTEQIKNYNYKWIDISWINICTRHFDWWSENCFSFSFW